MAFLICWGSDPFSSGWIGVTKRFWWCMLLFSRSPLLAGLTGDTRGRPKSICKAIPLLTYIYIYILYTPTSTLLPTCNMCLLATWNLSKGGSWKTSSFFKTPRLCRAILARPFGGIARPTLVVGPSLKASPSDTGKRGAWTIRSG